VFMRIAVVAAAVCLTIVGVSGADDAKASMRIATDIPAQNLGSALKALAQTRDLQVLYFSDSVRDVRTGGAAGELTTDEALTQLLSGTGLTYRYVSEKAVTILPSAEAPSGDTLTQPASAPAGSGTGDSQKEGKKSSSDGFRVAQAAQGQNSSPPSVENQTQVGSKQKPVQLEEIVVTAQKREEKLQDVPVPVTVISAETLIDRNQLRLQDYYSTVPGLSLSTGDRGEPFLAVRGISTGYGGGNPTVGITIDDVPYGESTTLGGGSTAPDIDPSDLARVEVLRGPQGTLYGASSIGGLVKFVTVDPSTESLSGRVQAGLTSVENGADVGYNLHGAVNVPLGDTLAVRASGYFRREPGYIDDPGLGLRGVNRVDSDGGRLSALWRLSPDVSLKFSALIQDTKRRGSSDVDLQPGLGDLQQSALRGTGEYTRKTQAYSANLTAKLGGATLTAISGYTDDSFSSVLDATPVYGGLAMTFFGVTGAQFPDHRGATKFTQEIRVLTPVGQRLEWLFGAFYTHESSPGQQTVLAADPATGAPVGVLLHATFPGTYEEYAAFTDLTFHVTNRFDVQIGGRESENKQTLTEAYTGAFFNAAAPKADSSDHAFTYLVTPQFKVSPDLMVYARLASGYRAGGPNVLLPGSGVQPTFGPDRTQNYEVGVKGDVGDHALSFDASLYHIDWKDLQLLAVQGGFGFFANGSRAKSQGLELSLVSRPVTGLTVAAWVAWDDAELTQDLPPTSQVVGLSGDRLPYSSRFSGNLSLDQQFRLTPGLTGFVGGSLRYAGGREGIFTATPQRENLPAYAQTDVRAGVKHDSWTLNLFANNVADRRGVLSAGVPFAYVVNYIQPRTVGLSVVKTF
jgi:iron complex outermembrane receptor protein